MTPGACTGSRSVDRCVRVLTLTAAFILVWCAPVAAELLVYEPFDYAEGTLLAEGLEGGSPPEAFDAGGWITDQNSPEDYDVVVAGSLSATTAPALLTAGASALVHSFQDEDPAARQPESRTSRNLNHTRLTAAAAGPTLWFSFLLQKESGSSEPADAGLIDLIPSGFGNVTLSVGDNLSDGTLSLARSGSGTTFASTGVTVVTGTTYLLVGRINLGSSSTASSLLYVDPTPGLSAPDTPGTSLSGFTFQNVNLLRLRADNHQNGAAYVFDELRIGQTYADVTPVPEPSSALLLVLGLSASLARTRRSRLR